MKLHQIYSIPGKSGLFLMVSQAKNNGVVESLEDKKRFPVFSSERISSLEEIAIYTEDKEVPLKEVFQNIYRKENGNECIDPKSDAKKLKAYFEEILPAYDKERVYISDIKKVFVWYNLLLKNNLVDLNNEEDTQENEAEEKQ